MTAPPPVASATTVRGGLGVFEAIAGAGLLLMPAVALATAGSTLAPAAWVLHGAVGGLLCVALGTAARRQPPGSTLATLVGDGFGHRFGRAVVGLYLLGFVAGQAAIGYAAGGFAGAATGWSGGPATAGLGLLVLLAAAALALRGWSMSPAARRLRLALTLAVAVYLGTRPGLLHTAGLLPDPPERRFWLAVFVLFFAFVGWERIIRVAPGLRRGRSVAAATGIAATLAIGGYLALAVLLGQLVAATGRPPLSGPDQLAGLVAAGVLGSYCVTNITTAGGFVQALAPVPPRTAGLLVVAAAGTLLIAAVVAGWAVRGLLLGPAVAAWASYGLAMATIIHCGPRLARPVATVVLISLLAMAVLATGEQLATTG